MRTALFMAIAGLLLGALGTLLLVRHDVVAPGVTIGGSPIEPPRIETVPPVSVAAAEAHRDSHFAAIRSIEDTLALPGDFAQTEALYALAGRSDSAGVQDLIFQANGIADPGDRRAALDILFLRLAELDPRSALALSRSRAFRSERQIEAGVWHHWGKLDLDAALTAAVATESRADRNIAAQALFAAHGYMGNGNTDHIEAMLGIGPASTTRANYIYRLASLGPAVAIAAINDTGSPSQKAELASFLGHHLARLDPDGAARHASLFRDEMARSAYASAVTGAAAEVHPEAVLDELLASSPTRSQAVQAQRALQVLAVQDLEKAIDYIEQVTNHRYRAMLASTIGRVLAERDPERALEWAKEHDPGLHQGLLWNVLSAIAGTDPDRAVAEALRLPNANHRQQALSMVASTLSQRDPRQAIAMLDRLERPQDRSSVAQMVGSQWLHAEPDAAMQWMLSRDSDERRSMLTMAAHALPHRDLESAMRWLPRLEEEYQAQWRSQIAANLATQRSAEEAQAFIARFEGTDEYPQLLASVVNGLAQTDIGAAAGLASRVPAGPERDSLYTGLVSQFGSQDPQQAAALLSSIGDDAQRAQATGMLAMVWTHRDPDGAQRWVESLPRGDDRDDAILHLVMNWDDVTPSRRLLLGSIGNLEKRRQAQVMHVQQLVRTNPQQADRLMDEYDISDQEWTEFTGTVRARRPGR